MTADDESDSFRILLTTPDYQSTGGIQTLTRNLERGLKELGHTVRVVHVDQEEEYSLSDYFPRVRWCTSFQDLFSGRWLYRNAVHVATRDAVAEFDPDIVHALHIEHFPALLAAAKADIPSVLSTYALELQDNSLAAKAFTKADSIHTISDFTTELVRNIISNKIKGGGKIHGDIYLVPPSIDVDRYRPAEQPSIDELPDEDAPVLTLSRLEEGYKNIETIIEAWKHLPTSVTADRELLVAGDGPQRSDLESLAEPESTVRFLGWIDEDEKRQLLTDAAVFAFVPRREEVYGAEGFGIVYIEAQAAGTPVVGSNNGGAPEAVGEGGIVVENESDPEEVAAAIRQLLTDVDVRRKRLREAKDRIDQFGIQAIASNHVEHYQSLIDHNSTYYS